MDCAQTESALLDYHFAVGTQAERDAIRAHLRTCMSCAQEYLDLKHDIDSGAAMAQRPSDPARQRLRKEVATLFSPTIFARARGWVAQPTPRYRALAAMAAVMAVTFGISTLRPVKPGADHEDEARIAARYIPDTFHQPHAMPVHHRPKLAPPRFSDAVEEDLQAAYTLPRVAVDSARPQAVSITYY